MKKLGLLNFVKHLLNRFEVFLEEQSAKAEAELELRKITNSSFAAEMARVAEAMSERYGTSFLWVMEEAKRRILSGEDQAEVLWYFYKQLLKEGVEK